MIGVTYQVETVTGETYRFRSTLVDEMAWESYATKNKLPINPTVTGNGTADLASFPMAANGAVLAWSHAKHQQGGTAGLDEFAGTLRSVMPVDESEAGPPDPTPPGPGPG